MKTLTFFNNKGGVGKTTLAYNLSYMFSRIGVNVLAVDLDPQANFTSAFLSDEALEELWEDSENTRTILACVNPLIAEMGDFGESQLKEVDENLWLLPGHLGLSRFEDRLSESWAKVLGGTDPPIRVTTAFYRIIQQMGKKVSADLALVDIGPNLGAINRAALLATDYVVIPLAADLFSLQGLRNLGPTLTKWKDHWNRVAKSETKIPVPKGEMARIGYVILQHVVRQDRPVKAFKKWTERIPIEYQRSVLGETHPKEVSIENDKHCLANLRNYRSLMPMAHEARKPMFLLKAADGAIGGHSNLVADCYKDFEALAKKIAEKINLPLQK